MAPAQNPISSQHVVVIGAGAAGLVAARELSREGHTVVVLEREKEVGGLWIYSPKAESDPLSLDPTRSIVHSSVYESLRTNLPRECMGFTDFPFVPRFDDESRDSRRYPSHMEVLAYLQDFAREFNLEEMVRFEIEVVRVEPVNGKWRVWSKTSGGVSHDEIFDAVVVCSGHYTEPNVAHIPGKDHFLTTYFIFKKITLFSHIYLCNIFYKTMDCKRTNKIAMVSDHTLFLHLQLLFYPFFVFYIYYMVFFKIK